MEADELPLEEQLIRSTFLDILAIYRGADLSCQKGVRLNGSEQRFLSKSSSSARRFSTFWLSMGCRPKLSKRRLVKWKRTRLPLEEQLIRSTFLDILAIYRGADLSCQKGVRLNGSGRDSTRRAAHPLDVSRHSGYL